MTNFTTGRIGTKIKKLSSVDLLGPADEVTEIMTEFSYIDEEIANRLARKAIKQKLVFSVENILDMKDLIEEELHNKLLLQCFALF